MIIISDVINVSIINYKINVGKSTVELKKKTEHESFSNVNLVLSICQLIVCLLDNTDQIIFFFMSLNFEHNSNLSVIGFTLCIKKNKKIVSIFFKCPVLFLNPTVPIFY
jgi:hypothetical protein